MASDPTMKVRSGGIPAPSIASMPKKSMDPPPWSQTDAYDCIMIPIRDEIDRIQGCDARG